MQKKSKKILVVDDEKAMTKALTLKLTAKGYAVRTASRGVEALVLLKKEPFDLVLLDIIMPTVDGFMVLEEMKKNGIKTPVIILSSLEQEEDKKRAKALGVREFFTKSSTSLLDLVEYVQKIV